MALSLSGDYSYAAYVQPALLWAVGVLASAVLALLVLIAKYAWVRITDITHKLNEALVLLYALCHAVKPPGVDCDKIGKVICRSED